MWTSEAMHSGQWRGGTSFLKNSKTFISNFDNFEATYTYRYDKFVLYLTLLVHNFSSPTVHWSVGVLAGLLLVRNDQSRVGHQSEASAAWRRGEQGEIILLVQCSSRVKNCCIQNIVGRHGFQVPGLGGCKSVLKLYILRST